MPSGQGDRGTERIRLLGIPDFCLAPVSRTGFKTWRWSRPGLLRLPRMALARLSFATRAKSRADRLVTAIFSAPRGLTGFADC